MSNWKHCYSLEQVQRNPYVDEVDVTSAFDVITMSFEFACSKFDNKVKILYQKHKYIQNQIKTNYQYCLHQTQVTMSVQSTSKTFSDTNSVSN